MMEKEIQKQIKEYLRGKGVLTIHIPNGRGGTAQKYMNLGGVPDLVCFYDSMAFCIEVKQPGKKLKENQVRWFEHLQQVGIPCQAVHNVSEARAFFESLFYPEAELS